VQVLSIDLGLLIEVIILKLVDGLVRLGLERLHTRTRLSVENPAVEGTLNALAVLDRAAQAKVGAHVRAVGVKGIHSAVCASEDNNLPTAVVDEADLADFQLIAVKDRIPAVGEKGRALAAGPVRLLFGHVVELVVEVELELAQVESVDSGGECDQAGVEEGVVVGVY